MILICIFIYLGPGNGLFKYNCFISKHKTFPYFVDTMLFTKSFVVVIVAVGLIKPPSKSIKLPHTVNILLCVSDLFGLISHTICLHVTFFVEKGTSLLGMNVNVFVRSIIVPTP